MKKTLQDLTIKDDFMFGAVMAEEENCRGLLERVTGLSIGRVEISRERSLAYRPEYRGIRLDVYVKVRKIPAITWKCKWFEKLRWKKEPAITEARWIWICCWRARAMRTFRIPM